MPPEPRAGTPWTAAQREALAVLATDVVGDAVAERLVHALVARLRGRAAEFGEPFDEQDLAAARAVADEHRIRSAVNRVLPGAGGDAIEALAAAVAMEQRLLGVIDRFGSAGLAVAVLKGNATARLDHRDPGDREAGDIDVLVPVATYAATASMLHGAGFEQTVTHPFATSSFFHSETFRHRDGWELDVHVRLAQASRAPVSCWDDLETFELGGREVPALARPWRFLHAMVHQLMNPPPSFRGVNGLLDLVSMWERGVDLAAVRRAADEVGLRAVLERGLVRLGTLLEVPIPAEEPSGLGWVERRLARAVDGNDPIPGPVSFVSGISAQPWSARPRYVRELLWPTPDYRRLLGVSPVQQLRHVVAEALGRRR